MKIWDSKLHVNRLTELYSDEEVKFYFERSMVIRDLSSLQDEEMEWGDDLKKIDYESMTNKELEEHYCLSGFVHDAYMAGVIDDC